MSGLQIEARNIYNSQLSEIISDNDTRSKLNKLGIFSVSDLVTYFPKRYINLEKCTPIGSTILNKKNVVCGEIHDVSKRDLNGKSVYDITLLDKSGVILFTIYDKKQLLEIEQDTYLVVSGDVYFDYGFKRMANPLLVNASSPVKSNILPVYETRFVCDQLTVREAVRQALYRLEFLESPHDKCNTSSLTYAQALRNIHFAKDVATLKSANRRIKFEELMNCDLSVVSSVPKGNYPVKCSLKIPADKSVSIYCMKDIGDALEHARISLNSGAKVFFLSPLAGLSSSERDKMTIFGKNSEIDTNAYYPKVCIENNLDCKAYAGKNEIYKRKNYFSGILNARDDEVFVVDNINKIREMRPSDCLFVEDADRYSLLALYEILQDVKCDVVLLSRSKKGEAIERLNMLNQTKCYGDLLEFELKSRYQGDILGNRDKSLAGLKLINLYKDRELIYRALDLKSDD